MNETGTHSVWLTELHAMLAAEKNQQIDNRDYMSWDYYDEKGYAVALGKKEARIDLLETLIARIHSQD